MTVFLAGRWLVNQRTAVKTGDLLVDYNNQVDVLDQEYLKYYGTPLREGQLASAPGERKQPARAGGDEIHAAFRQAGALASRRNFPSAAAVLEELSRETPLPVIFSNLGIVYSILGDNGRAADSFREVLVRDSGYPAVREFLRTRSSLKPGAAEPYTQEAEPNNEYRAANLIGMGAPVGGEIAASADDIDYFRVIAPPSPRDLLEIQVTNHTSTFAPRLRVYDGTMRLVGGRDKIGGAGESLRVIGGPAPNSNVYIAISAAAPGAGRYVLGVTPQRAYDAYEPNDEIGMARRIAVGQDVNANIMDSEDTDYFSFVSPWQGAVQIGIQNRSDGLVPAMALYDADRRNIGSGPDVKKPGLDLDYTLHAQKDAVYYVQVWAPAGSGAYTLRVN